MLNLNTSPLPGSMRWCFESLDVVRRQRGQTLERFGFGAVPARSEVLLETATFRLHAYAAAAASPAALIVPAPIKRHYIWDLAPGSSVVRHALDSGLRPYLIEWKDPTPETDRLGLDEYGLALLDQCVDAVHKHAGTAAPILFAHSLGGVFATIYAAQRPERVAGLVLIETPLHFGKGSGSFAPLLAVTPPARQVMRAFSSVPGTVLSMASLMASPATFGLERYADLVASMGSREDMRRHFQVERWTLDEAPMASALFEQVIELLYRQDRLHRGELEIAGEPVGPARVISPMLAVYDPRSRVIPPDSVIAFYSAAASPRKRLLAYEGDKGVGLAHVGALIGATAHQKLWPEIFAWVESLSHAGT